MDAETEVCAEIEEAVNCLGVPLENLSQKLLNAKWHEAALKYHPDKNNDPFAEENFKKAKRSHEILLTELEKRERNKNSMQFTWARPYTGVFYDEGESPYQIKWLRDDTAWLVGQLQLLQDDHESLFSWLATLPTITRYSDLLRVHNEVEQRYTMLAYRKHGPMYCLCPADRPRKIEVMKVPQVFSALRTHQKRKYAKKESK